MKEDRRKEDERIDKLVEMTTKHGILIEQVHKSWFGINGDAGYKTKIDKMEGAIGTWRWLAGGGGIIGIAALIVTIYKLFN